MGQVSFKPPQIRAVVTDPPAFDPTSLAGKVLWLRAKDLVGANGASVTTWADQSGAGCDAVSSAGTIVTGATPGGGRVYRNGGGNLLLATLGMNQVGGVFPSASSQYNASLGPDKLNNGTTNDEWVSSSSSLPQWAQYRLSGGAAVVTQYSMRATSGNEGNAPKNWTLLGRNENDASWTTLDTQTNVTLVNASATSFSFSNSTPYLFYRLNVTARNGGSNEVRFAEWNLTGVSTGSLSAGPGEAWMIMKTSDTGNQWWVTGAGGSSCHYLYGSTVYDDFGTTTRDSFTPTMSASSDYRLNHVSVGTGGVKVWTMDGVLQLAVTRTPGWYAGSNELGRGWIGDYAEVLIRDRVSTPAEAAALTAYFNTEHGLTVPIPVGEWLTTEGTGTSVADTSGNGATGTAWPPAAWVSSALHSHAVLEGNGTSTGGGGHRTVEIATGTPAPSSAITVMCWVKMHTTDDGPTYQAVFSKSGPSGYATYGLYGHYGASRFYAALQMNLSVGGGFALVDSAARLGDGAWHHIAATYDGATVRLYVDGTERNSVSKTGTLAYSSDAITLLSDMAFGSEAKGQGSEFRIFNTALSAGQIAALMAG